MDDQLLKKIETLSDSDLMEATEYYLADEIGVENLPNLEGLLVTFCDEFEADYWVLKSVCDSLSKERQSFRDLLRLLMRITVKESADKRHVVLSAIDGVGKKAVVAETAMVASLAILATMQLIIYTKGREKETEKLKINEKPDGTLEIEFLKETVYASSSSALGSLFQWLKDSISGKP